MVTGGWSAQVASEDGKDKARVCLGALAWTMEKAERDAKSNVTRKGSVAIAVAIRAAGVYQSCMLSNPTCAHSI